MDFFNVDTESIRERHTLVLCFNTNANTQGSRRIFVPSTSLPALPRNVFHDVCMHALNLTVSLRGRDGFLDHQSQSQILKSKRTNVPAQPKLLLVTNWLLLRTIMARSDSSFGAAVGFDAIIDLIDDEMWIDKLPEDDVAPAAADGPSLVDEDGQELFRRALIAMEHAFISELHLTPHCVEFSTPRSRCQATKWEMSCKSHVAFIHPACRCPRVGA